MSKKLTLTIVVILILCIAIGYWAFYILKKQSTSNQNSISDIKKLKVVTTLFPIYDFAKNIGKDKIEVMLLLPPGVEAHSFELTPGDVIEINQADILIYTNKFMEPWISDIIKGVTNKNLLIVNTSEDIKLIPAVFHDADEPAGSMDPHIWLDFDNAKMMVNSIAKAFIDKDTSNKAFYEKNAIDYNQLLADLDKDYKSTIISCKLKKIIYAGHYAFGYLAKRYGLDYIAAQGISPDSEPTARDLAVLIDQINKDNIKYVFYEELASPRIAEMLSKETNTDLLLLNAAHNISKEQLEKGISFTEIMKNNLNNLKIGLEYKQ